MVKIFKRTSRFLIKRFFQLLRFLFHGKNNRYIFYPVFDKSNDLTDQIYRLIWYLPQRKTNSIKLCYHSFNFNLNILKRDLNRPWYLHDLPLNLDNICLSRYNIHFKNLRFLFSLAMSDIVLVWNEEEGVGFINKIAGLICVVKTIDHKNLSYRSDINYVKLLHMSMKSKEINAIIDKSQRIFNKKVIELRDTYDKSYIFGRGPSLDNAYKYNYHDGVRIVANQIVKDVNLMGHINPHFIVACDHAWHFGCSKVADYYRRDLMSYVKKNDVLYVIPLDSYPLILFHYPELKNNIIAVPYKGNNHIFDLTINYYTMGSLGVLFEFQFPIACTVSKNIVMLGFDGQAPMVKSDVVYPYSRVATYPKEIVNSIYAARPGYYDKDLSEFKDEFSKLLGSMINDAEEQGFEIKTLAPSYHLALSDKFLES